MQRYQPPVGPKPWQHPGSKGEGNFVPIELEACLLVVDKHHCGVKPLVHELSFCSRHQFTRAVGCM